MSLPCAHMETIDIEYVSDVRVEFPDGQTIEYQETGKLQDAQYDYAYVSTTPRKS